MRPLPLGRVGHLIDQQVFERRAEEPLRRRRARDVRADMRKLRAKRGENFIVRQTGVADEAIDLDRLGETRRDVCRHLAEKVVSSSCFFRSSSMAKSVTKAQTLRERGVNTALTYGRGGGGGRGGGRGGEATSQRVERSGGRIGD